LSLLPPQHGQRRDTFDVHNLFLILAAQSLVLLRVPLQLLLFAFGSRQVSPPLLKLPAEGCIAVIARGEILSLLPQRLLDFLPS